MKKENKRQLVRVILGCLVISSIFFVISGTYFLVKSKEIKLVKQQFAESKNTNNSLVTEANTLKQRAIKQVLEMQALQKKVEESHQTISNLRCAIQTVESTRNKLAQKNEALMSRLKLSPTNKEFTDMAERYEKDLIKRDRRILALDNKVAFYLSFISWFTEMFEKYLAQVSPLAIENFNLRTQLRHGQHLSQPENEGGLVLSFFRMVELNRTLLLSLKKYRILFKKYSDKLFKKNEVIK